MDILTGLRSRTASDRLDDVWRSLVEEARGVDNYYGLCSPTPRPGYDLHELLEVTTAGKTFLDVGCFDKQCLRRVDECCYTRRGGN